MEKEKFEYGYTAEEIADVLEAWEKKLAADGDTAEGTKLALTLRIAGMHLRVSDKLIERLTKDLHGTGRSSWPCFGADMDLHPTP